MAFIYDNIKIGIIAVFYSLFHFSLLYFQEK